MSARIISVVVPAHDEQDVIARCLSTMTAGAEPGELDIVVVCNGCTDATAQVAAAFPGVRVVEVSQPSKIGALNAGDRVAAGYPRAYIDADIEVDVHALRAVAAELGRPGVLAAAPEMVLDDTRSSWAVRAHNEIWQLTEYRRDDMIGSGVYALSETGRARFGAFPDLIADDLFVRNLFAPGERRTVHGQSFTVHAPRTLASLLHRATRAAAGNQQWQATSSRTAAVPVGGSRAALLRRVAREPRRWPAVGVFGYVYIAARVGGRRKLARGAAGAWERDDTSRVANEFLTTTTAGAKPVEPGRSGDV